VTIAGICRSLREGFAERQVWLHYRYFDRALPKESQGRVHWVSTEVSEPNQGGHIAKQIDARFDAAPDPTWSLEDDVRVQAEIGNFSAILTALDTVSYLVLAVVMSIIGNTLAMNVRERTHEYGVMRAIGFRRAHVVKEMMLEVLAVSLLGGALGWAAGAAASWALMPYFSQTGMAFEADPRLAGLSLVAALAVGALSSLYPTLRASRLDPSEAVRHV